MVEKNIRLKTHLGNGVYETLHPETNSEIVRVGDKNLDETLGEVTAQLAQTQKNFDTAVGAVTVDSEVVLARGDKTTLGVRLGETDGRISKLETEKANKKQEAWITPTLINGWVSESSEEFSQVGYMKDEMGFVHLKGQVTGTTIDTQVFSLPTGYRPADKYLRFPTNSNNGQLGALWIGSSGTVTINKGPIYSVSLNGIIFKAEK